MNSKIPPIGTWDGISLLLAGLSLPLTPFAQTGQALVTPWQQLQPVGRGEMSWLWFKLYDATLYSENGYRGVTILRHSASPTPEPSSGTIC